MQMTNFLMILLLSEVERHVRAEHAEVDLVFHFWLWVQFSMNIKLISSQKPFVAEDLESSLLVRAQKMATH